VASNRQLTNVPNTNAENRITLSKSWIALKPFLYLIADLTQQPGANYRVGTNIEINTNTYRKLQLIKVVQIQTQVSETALSTIGKKQPWHNLGAFLSCIYSE
jgi:hypothetical protein